MPYSLRSKNKPDWQIPIGEKPLRIGRASDNDVILQDLKISRQHAVIREEGGLLKLADLNSKGGTFVNHARVMKAVLKAGDEIAFGGEQFTVIGEAPAQTPAPAAEQTAVPPVPPPAKRSSLAIWIGAAGGLLVVILIAVLLLFNLPPAATPEEIAGQTMTAILQAVETQTAAALQTPAAPPATQTPEAVTAAVPAGQESACRSGPGLAYTELSILPGETTAQVVGRNEIAGVWYLLRLADNSECWVRGDRVVLSGNLSLVPVVTPANP